MLLSHLNLLATAPGGVARLRELILTLAVQGKLVAQDPNDEPASELLQRVAASAAVRSVKSIKAIGGSDEIDAPYGLPAAWAWSRLGDIVENMGSGWSPACDEGERIDQTRWAVLRTTAVQVNEYRAREHKVIPAKLSPRPEIEVKDGDILITRAGPMNRVGISCWVNNTPPRLMLSDKIVRFHAIADEMLPAFIVLALNAGWTKSQIEEAKTGMAASQVNISQTDLRGFWLPVCNKAEQSRIVTRVEELMRLCDALETKSQLEATQHAQLVSTLLDTLTQSETPEQLTENWQRVATHFDLLLDRPEAVDALEQTILQLAVRGLLVPQDPQDEPASELLKKIRTEKDKLILEGKIKRDKPLPPIAEDGQPFALPQGWSWARFPELGQFGRGKSKHRPRNDPALFNPPIYPVVQTGEVARAKGVIHEYHSKYSEIGLAQSRLWPAGTLCITIAANIADAALLGFEACFPDSVVGFIPAEAIGDSRYFLAFMETARTELIAYAPATAQKNINLEILESVLIPLPPATEMSRIVTRLAQLRCLCADLRQRLTASQATQAHLGAALVENIV